MPRPDGKPKIVELIASTLIVAAKKQDEYDPVTLVQELEEKLGHTPSIDELTVYWYDLLGIDPPDPRQDKPWPPEEDCRGCDQHQDGPHRFSCYTHGARQLTLPVVQTEDGKFKVVLPEKKS